MRAVMEQRDQLLSRTILLLLLGLALLPTLLSVVGQHQFLTASFHDDAYYYFRIAENIARGNGSTFDGINTTNGYQPLWCWLLVPFAAVKVHLLPGSYLELYGAFVTMLFVGLAVLVQRLGSLLAGGGGTLYPASFVWPSDDLVQRGHGINTPWRAHRAISMAVADAPCRVVGLAARLAECSDCVDAA